MSEQSPEMPRLDGPASTGGRVVGAIVLVGLAAGGALMWATRPSAAGATARSAAAATLVRAATAKLAAAPAEVSLLGVARPAEVATVIARQSGVVSELLVDLGDRVTAGQRIASIAAVESADELRASRAAVAAADESLRLATITRDRARGLAAAGTASAQEVDVAESDWTRAKANLAAARAASSRLSTLAGYQQVVAPMAGVVTRRLVDPGALAQAGQTALLQLAMTGDLDVELEVPQAMAGSVQPGAAVTVGSRDLGARTVPATISRTSGVIDPTTRTMRAEIRLPGDAGVMPGGTVDVRLSVVRPQPPALVPARALAVRPEGLAVAVIDGSGRVSWQKVAVVRDLGKDVELSVDGKLVAGAKVVLSPPVTLADGDAVEIAPEPPPPPRAGSGSGSAGSGSAGGRSGSAAGSGR